MDIDTIEPVPVAAKTLNNEGNEVDKSDMHRMGKRQVFRREFHFFSIWGYGVILSSSWEVALINSVLSLPNGGTAGSIWMTIIACFFMFFVTLSMAEMASIAPTAGGQYHWCSEFAPKRIQKFLSYYVGFFCVLGWQANLAGATFASAQQIQAMVVVAHLDNYYIRPWTTALISWALLLLAIFCNTLIFRKLPLIEGLFFILHIMGFIAFVVVLWVMAPRGDIAVLTTFSSNGWSSSGLACLVGLNAAVGNTIGADSSVHLAEELKDASWVLPRSMVAAAGLNYVVAIIMVITLMFCLGDYDTIVGSATGQPYVQVLLNATRSPAATIILTAVVLTLTTASLINALATISRQLWSFARDGALPFSKWLARVQPGIIIPLNAILVSSGISVGLTAISIGSATAYGIIVSLCLSGLLTSYLICIGCVFYQRNWGDGLAPSRFNLGKTKGNLINVIAFSFLLVALTFQFFPYAPNPDAKDMNWSIVIYMGVFLFFTAYYFVRARHRYAGPVVYVKKTQQGVNEKQAFR